MKTLLKLVIVGIILNAAFHAGNAAWKFYQLKDTTHRELILGEHTPTEQLQARILKQARDLKLPLSEENVTVTREGLRTAARVSYHQEIELFPSFMYPHDFAFSDEVAPIR